MRRWKSNTNTIRGAVTTTLAAVIRPHGITKVPVPSNMEIAGGTVWIPRP